MQTNTPGTAGEEPSTAPRFNPPDTFVILFVIAILAWIATWLVPAGRFAETGGTISLETFEALSANGAPLFSTDGRTGFLNSMFDGLVSGDRYSATVGLLAFLLIVGGAFGVIMRTGAMEAAVGALLHGRTRPADWLAPLLFVIFSICGAVFGMGEEAVVFVLILAPAFVRVGYDSMTAFLCCFAATQIGFATSWMNPFSVVVAQGIAGLPILSGAGFRAIMWLIFTGLGAAFVYAYARRVRLDPARSPVRSSDLKYFSKAAEAETPAFTLGHGLILFSILATIGWVAWGVAAKQYYFAEMAAQFLTLGLVAAFIARVFKLNGMTFNTASEAFREGANMMIPAILIIGIAKGIVALLGGDGASTASVLNTLLANLAGLTNGLPEAVSALAMFIAQSIINMFVVSGSGQAALTMPLMAPLADLNGLSRQIAVLAFQLGDGLTNLICPASGALIASLSAARIEWTTWLGFCWKIMVALMALAAGFILVAVGIGYV
jgi:uncharacterized ion transporter superfamily protein YfcC